MKFFVTDGSDLNGIRSPLDIRYMKYLRILLIMIGAWPGKALGEKEVHRPRVKIYNVFISNITFVTGLIFIKNSIGKLSFFELGQSYITILMNGICVVRFLSFFVSRKLDDMIVDFVRDIHLFNHRNRSKIAGKTNLYIHKLSYAYTVYTMVLVATLAPSFNFIPLFNNISNGAFTGNLPANQSYEQPVYYALPFDYEHNFTGFLLLSMFNFYITTTCGILFLSYDLMVALLVFHLWGHLKILTYNLQNFPPPGFVFEEESEDFNKEITNRNTIYSDEELVEVNRRLKSIINHHKSILKYNADISKAVGINVAFYYLFNQICGCLLLLELSELEPKAFFRFGPLTIGLLQMLMTVSVIFELIKSMTDHVVRAAYNVPWECMDPKNRKLMMMLLRQTQIPLGLKALGMVDVGVQTMATILKTTLSYFMMLRTTAYKQ